MTNDIDVLFNQQKENQNNIKNSDSGQRIQKLELIENYLNNEKNLDQLYHAMYTDLKKPKAEILISETGIIHAHLSFVKKNLKKWMKPEKVSRPLSLLGTKSHIQYEPKGITLIISPWNYPLNLSIVPLIYALSAGNSIVLKPSEISSSTSRFIKKMITDLFDEKEVAVVEGGSNIAQELLGKPFDHIFFTGSPQIGKIVMSEAAKNLSSVTLELGGKSPSIIDETADLSGISEKCTWAKFINTGQSCIAPDYLILKDVVYNDFLENMIYSIEKLYSAQENIKMSSDYGRIINEKHFKRLESMFNDALEKGAHVVYGGEFDESSLYISPTILDNVSEDMEIMNDEIFGPILPVIKYSSTSEACDIVSRRPKPLTMYIASKDKKNINYLINHTTAGGSVINDYMLGYSNPNLPFGGVNNSGIGKSFGFHGFVEFSNQRSIIHRKWGNLNLIYPPYSEKKLEKLKEIHKWFS